jgi:3-phytase
MNAGPLGTPATLALLGVLMGMLVAACAGPGGQPQGGVSTGSVIPAPQPGPGPRNPAIVTEVWQTPRDTLDNIDSPAVWHGPEGQHWLIVTAKETDVLVVADATSGEVIERIGGEGAGAGQMDRPNGVAVQDDLLFLVERDNARVQVFSLPAFTPLGTYGEADLDYPYGIALVPEGDASYSTYVTDNYELADDVIPPDSLLDRRVRHYRVTVSDGAVDASLENTFGDTEGDGVLRVVESLAADPTHDRLMVAEEQEGASMIKVYTMGGSFRGEIIPDLYFPNQAEGIVLYACGDAGYWIATDQGEEVNTFHVFDRTTLEPVGSFRGRTVLNTDGIALTQAPFPGFPSGAFFAVHDDGNVAAFRWSDIAEPLGLRDCTAPPG